MFTSIPVIRLVCLDRLVSFISLIYASIVCQTQTLISSHPNTRDKLKLINGFRSTARSADRTCSYTFACDYEKHDKYDTPSSRQCSLLLDHGQHRELNNSMPSVTASIVVRTLFCVRVLRATGNRYSSIASSNYTRDFTLTHFSIFLVRLIFFFL